jgi:DNA-binding NtrC family response regulator
MNVLIIDNDKPFCDAACVLIEGEGLYAQTASSVDAGLALLKQIKFDAIFLDANLGAESGWDVLRQLRKEHVNIPVVVFAAGSTIGMAVEAMRLGAVDFLEKPLANENLHALIDRLKGYSQTNQSFERTPDVLDCSSPAMRQPGDLITLKELEEMHMRRVLQQTGSIAKTARILGIDPATIYRRRREWSRLGAPLPKCEVNGKAWG